MMRVGIGLMFAALAVFGQNSGMPANVEGIGRVLGVDAAVRRICETRTASVEDRQRVLDAAIIATLDVQAALAEIDHERAEIFEVRSTLSAGRDRRINWLTVANIVVAAGSGVIGTALQFNDRTALTGDAIGVAGGAAGVVISLLALRQQGGVQPLGVAPNMLAPIFDRRVELRSIYPESVWDYLNAAPFSDPRIKSSWRDDLIRGWTQRGRIGPDGEARAALKIDALTSRIGEKRKLSIDLLNDRNAMLMDLRARIALMNVDLRDLMKTISAGSGCLAAGPR